MSRLHFSSSSPSAVYHRSLKFGWWLQNLTLYKRTGHMVERQASNRQQPLLSSDQVYGLVHTHALWFAFISKAKIVLKRHFFSPQF